MGWHSESEQCMQNPTAGGSLTFQGSAEGSGLESSNYMGEKKKMCTVQMPRKILILANMNIQMKIISEFNVP